MKLLGSMGSLHMQYETKRNSTNVIHEFKKCKINQYFENVLFEKNFS